MASSDFTIELDKINQRVKYKPSTSTIDDWQYLPIYDVAVQVVKNGIAGHVESQRAVDESLPFEMPLENLVQPLSFRTTNNVSETYELPLSLYVYGANSWSLKESGQLVADSSGFTVSGVSISSTTNAKIVNLSGVGKNKDYELHSDSEIEATDLKYLGGGTVVGSVIVDTFSTIALRQGFQLPKVSLTVPNQIPRNITSFANMFRTCTHFNQAIGDWDTSNITTAAAMFYKNTSFNQPIGDWDTSNMTSLQDMFGGNGSLFNQPIGNWNTRNVTSLGWMFFGNISFNQDIGAWDTSNVIKMTSVFNKASSFNQDLSGWCVTKIASPALEFSYAASSFTKPKPVWGTCPRGEDTIM